MVRRIWEILGICVTAESLPFVLSAMFLHDHKQLSHHTVIALRISVVVAIIPSWVLSTPRRAKQTTAALLQVLVPASWHGLKGFASTDPTPARLQHLDTATNNRKYHICIAAILISL